MTAQVATFDRETGEVVWRDKRATPRQIVRNIHGTWARTARENSLRGVLAFGELVPRDHESQRRWRNARHHMQYHLAAFKYPRLNVMGCIESGKSEQLTLVRTAWGIGIDPNLRFAIIGATATAAGDRVNAIKELVESRDYRAVFPGVRPGRTWTSEKFTVGNRKTIGDQNPTCQAIGLFTGKLGYRIDRAVFDDVIQITNSATEGMRNKTDQWLRATVLSRMTRDGRWINVQNPWHKDDFGHRLKSKGTPSIVHPFRKRDGTIRWNRFTDEWEREKRRELGPLMARALLDCKPYSGTLSRFKDEWIRKALHNGKGQTFYHQAQASHGTQIATGIDLGVSRRKKTDSNAMATLIGDQKRQVNLINLESDSVDEGVRWSGPDLVSRIEGHAGRYPRGRIIVEDNGAQDFLVQFAREVVSWVESHTTGRQKADPTFGLEGIATEMHSSAIGLPCEWVNDEGPLEFRAHPEVVKLVEEMQDYQPGQHVGDRLMAFWFAWHALRTGMGEIPVIQLVR